MDNLYYYLNPRLLKPGDIIEPGNWRKELESYNSDFDKGTYWRLLREQTFELERIKRFPDKPSRLDCVFLSPTREDAEQFRRDAKRESFNLYKVSIIDTRKLIHHGSMTHTDRQWSNMLLVHLERSARKYWSGCDIHIKPEILTESAVQIVELVQMRTEASYP